MTWTPTEGMKRAASITDELLAAGAACNVVIQGDGHAVYRQRMMEVIARELDVALANDVQPIHNGLEHVHTISLQQHVPAGAFLTVTPAHPSTGVWNDPTPEAAPKKKRGPKKGSKRKPKAKAVVIEGSAP